MLLNQKIPLSLGVNAVARPAIFDRMFHTRAHRVELNVALAGQQVGVRLGRAGAKAPFPEAATAPISAIHILRGTLTECLHNFAKSGTPRHQQMNMIAHQDVRMTAATGISGMLRQSVEIEKVILVREKAGLPAIATPNQMERDIR